MIAQPLERAERFPPRLAALLVAVLLAAAWAVVYATGGTVNALPHVFYLPVVVAAVHFKLRGGLIAAVAATALCGPLMPLSVSAAVAQPVGNWMTRGAFFIAVGVFVGAAVREISESLVVRLADRFGQELEPQPVDLQDRDVSERVAAVMRQRQFGTVFQPIYDLATGRPTAVEALTRFDDGGSSQSPDVWFAQAAHVGLGADLELATAEAALIESSALPADVAVHLNASPPLLHDDRLARLLEQHSDREVVLEITEHDAVDDYDRLAWALQRLRERGAKIAVDDVGAGIASLRHVVRIGPDIIKLDVSLTQHLRHDPVRQALAKALVQFAHDTETTLVAEGIETEADLDMWRRLGADLGQGYLLGHPAPLPFELRLSPKITARRRRSPRRELALADLIGLR